MGFLNLTNLSINLQHYY